MCFFIDGFLIDWFFAAAGVDLLLASTRLSPSIQVSSVGDQQSNFNGDAQKKYQQKITYLFSRNLSTLLTLEMLQHRQQRGGGEHQRINIFFDRLFTIVSFVMLLASPCVWRAQATAAVGTHTRERENRIKLFFRRRTSKHSDDDERRMGE